MFQRLKKAFINATRLVVSVTILIVLLYLLASAPNDFYPYLGVSIPLWGAVALLTKWSAGLVADYIPLTESFIKYYADWVFAICATILTLFNFAAIGAYSFGELTDWEFTALMGVQLVAYAGLFGVVFILALYLNPDWPTDDDKYLLLLAEKTPLR